MAQAFQKTTDATRWIHETQPHAPPGPFLVAVPAVPGLHVMVPLFLKVFVILRFFLDALIGHDIWCRFDEKPDFMHISFINQLIQTQEPLGLVWIAHV